MGVGSEMGSPGYQTDPVSKSNTGSARIGFSGPLSSPLTNNKRSGNRRRARFKDKEDYVEITLDIRDNTISVHNIKGGDRETALLASRLEWRLLWAPSSP
uniref:Uncharacterized protein n=1 Tax=Nelumbo nucifera TaxID=4432 RepID=A0A822XC87_NELNU|nr:TPA_asm: hypothetical protein HUJ06_019250 [Nelumbo nucifera]DAD17878.1 TPA_asm: hypothetical protein HUJ06_019341 [Nelumbo nucifera]